MAQLTPLPPTVSCFSKMQIDCTFLVPAHPDKGPLNGYVCVCILYSKLSTSKKTSHTHPFNGPFSRTTQVSRYQKGKTNLDFTEARDSEGQWHQLGHMQVSTSIQTDNHASTPPLSFLQAGCPSCRPTNSIKALKANVTLRVEQYRKYDKY